MQTDTLRKNLTIGLMALCLPIGIILILLAFRSSSAQPSTAPVMSMSVIGALQPAPVTKPVDAASASSINRGDTGDACHQGGAGPDVVQFCEDYFRLNHPEVLK